MSTTDKRRVEIGRGIALSDHDKLQSALSTLLEILWPAGDDSPEWDSSTLEQIANALDQLRMEQKMRIVAPAGAFVRFNNRIYPAPSVNGGTQLPAGEYEFDGAEWTEAGAAPTPSTDLPRFRVGQRVAGCWDMADDVFYTVGHIERAQRGETWTYQLYADKGVNYSKTGVQEKNILELEGLRPQQPIWEKDPVGGFKLGQKLSVGSIMGQIYKVVRIDAVRNKMPVYIMQDDATGMALSVSEDSLWAVPK